ncbi:MAG: single-stranded DNA-binding protein [Actinomycetota bacterium]|jgi:single-strand DNA-binding protein|nr:single-stranded DNA-binding protein [Actinomycetota bacterium]
MNTVNLTGRLTRDPEARATSSGQDVCAMRVAVDGPREADTVFVDLTAFGGLAANCAEHLTKGRHVAVTGRLHYSEWEAQDGAKRSKHEVIAGTVDFLPGGREPAEAEPAPTEASDTPT